MGKKVTAIVVTLILIGVVAGCGIGTVTEPSKQVIDLPCTWSLESLGYSDLVFSCENPHEAKSVKFTLTEDAAQGPENWYIVHLHFSIKFSEESEVDSH